MNIFNYLIAIKNIPYYLYEIRNKIVNVDIDRYIYNKYIHKLYYNRSYNIDIVDIYTNKLILQNTRDSLSIIKGKINYNPGLSYIGTISNIYIIQYKISKVKCNAIYIKNNVVIGLIINKKKDRNKHLLKIKITKKPKNRYKGTYLPMIGPTAHNFGHFIFEHLTKLRKCEMYYGDISNVRVILSDKVDWKIKLLNIVGVCNNNIYIEKNNMLLEKIIITEPRPVYMKEYSISSEDIVWVKNKIDVYSETILSKQVNKMMYLKRNINRRIDSQSEKIIEKYGYKSVDAGKYNIDDKIRILNNTKNIITTVGSNIANIMFIKELKNIVVCSNYHFPAHMFHVLLSTLNIKIHHIIDESILNNEISPNENVIVNKKKLIKTLNIIKIK